MPKILAHNQITGSDTGLKVTHPDLISFLAYDNSLTGNRIGFHWTRAAPMIVLSTEHDSNFKVIRKRLFYAQTPWSNQSRAGQPLPLRFLVGD